MSDKMSFRIMRAAILMFLIATAACAQVHLLSGTPTPDVVEAYPLILFRLESDGKLQQVSEVVPAKPGFEWIALDYDLRKAFILPRSADRLLLDLDRAAVIKRCSDPTP